MEDAGLEAMGSRQKMMAMGPWRYGRHLIFAVCTLKPSHDNMVQLVRSLVVSVVALIADFGTLVLLKEGAGLHYLVAATLAFGVGVVVNYALSTLWVFARRKLDSKHAEFTIFVIICVLGLVFNLVIIAGLVEWMGLDYRLAKAVATVVVFFWNFFARKKILY